MYSRDAALSFFTAQGLSEGGTSRYWFPSSQISIYYTPWGGVCQDTARRGGYHPPAVPQRITGHAVGATCGRPRIPQRISVYAVGADPVAFCEAKRAIGPKGAAKDPPANAPGFDRITILFVGKLRSPVQHSGAARAGEDTGPYIRLGSLLRCRGCCPQRPARRSAAESIRRAAAHPLFTIP
jgi:hypothetical protein